MAARMSNCQGHIRDSRGTLPTASVRVHLGRMSEIELGQTKFHAPRKGFRILRESPDTLLGMAVLRTEMAEEQSLESPHSNASVMHRDQERASGSVSDPNIKNVESVNSVLLS